MRYHSLGRRPGQAPHPDPRGRPPARRGGHGLRGLQRQRVDPLPPPLAVPDRRGRRVHADRARGVGPRHARPPADRHARRSSPAATRSDGPPAAAVERRHRGLDLQADRGPGRLLPQRRGRRGRLRPPRQRRPAHDLRPRPVRARRLRRDPARDDAPLGAARRRAGLAVLPHARARSRRRTATATATASCSSTRRSASATSTRRPSSRRSRTTAASTR